MKMFASIFEILPINVRVLCWNIVNQSCVCFCFDNVESLFIICTIEHGQFNYLLTSTEYDTARDYYNEHSISAKTEKFTDPTGQDDINDRLAAVACDYAESCPFNATPEPYKSTNENPEIAARVEAFANYTDTDLQVEKNQRIALMSIMNSKYGKFGGVKHE